MSATLHYLTNLKKYCPENHSSIVKKYCGAGIRNTGTKHECDLIEPLNL